MRRLVLGSGPRTLKEEGDVHVDRLQFTNVDVVHDLNVTPWPFEDDSFVHVSALHLVEHLDSLTSFMDECWRVLRPGGSLYLETPLAGGDVDLEWADPMHKRCYRLHSFVNYFTLEGVARFGYTRRAWNIFLCRLDPTGTVIQVHAYPLKHDVEVLP